MAARAVQTNALPLIRCSDCGMETEMSMMGDHVCPKQIMSPLPPGRVNTPSALRVNSPINTSGLGPSANPPSRSQMIPRIRTHGMDRPLVMPNELTPNSSEHTSQTSSPKSATSGFRSPFRLPVRGMTLPLIPRPLSPELTNLDCAFPPFPTKASRSTTPVSDTKSQNSDGESIYVRTHAEQYNTSSAHRPVPRHNTSGTSHTKQAMAGNPMRRSRSATVGVSQKPAFRPPSAAKERRPSLTSLSKAPTRQIPAVPPLPSPPISILSREASPHLPKSANPFASGDNDKADTIQFIPTSVHPDIILSASGSAQNEQTGLISQTASRASLGLKQPPSSITISSSPALPGLPLGLHAPPNNASPRHKTDKVTGTGTNSFFLKRPSEPAQLSLVVEPAPTADTSEKERPNQPPSIITKFADRIISEHSASASLSSDNTNRSTMQTISSQSSFYPEDAAEKPTMSDANIISATSDFDLTPPDPIKIDHQLDSPTDPLFQQGRLTPIPDISVPKKESPQPHPHSRIPPPSGASSPPTPLPAQALASKGLCKGCSHPIAADSRSISSADGRLSGRYHKTCFVCTTCRLPFATADFYVLADAPYCAPHYHALNGSLCGACGTGIEGEYHAATRSAATGPEKFHARCFRCTLCRGRLQGDYFEHDGRFFCEMDIHRVVRPTVQRPNTRFGPGLRPQGQHPRGVGSRGYHTGHAPPRGRMPDRRTTKLMIMS